MGGSYFSSHIVFSSESNWIAIRNGNPSNLSECSIAQVGRNTLLFYNAGSMQEREGASNRIVSRLVTTTPLQLGNIMVVEPQPTSQPTPPVTTPTATKATTPIIPSTTPIGDEDEIELRMQLRSFEEEILNNVRDRLVESEGCDCVHSLPPIRTPEMRWIRGGLPY